MTRMILITGGFLMLRTNQYLGTVMILSGMIIQGYKYLKKNKK